MGLSKEITYFNGTSSAYHRIEALTLETNVRASIVVASYVSKAVRDAECEHGMALARAHYETAYDPDMTIVGAYTYLKTLPEFAGAEDVLEDGQEE